MLYYLQSFWKYLSQIWSKQPPFIERIPDYSSDGSQKSVLIYDDDNSSEEESPFYSRA